MGCTLTDPKCPKCGATIEYLGGDIPPCVCGWQYDPKQQDAEQKALDEARSG